MWTSLLKLLPAVASILKSFGGLFTTVTDFFRERKARNLKNEISESVEELKAAKTDSEISDAVKRINKL